MISQQVKRLIDDNPNLSANSISRLTGVNRWAINLYRGQVNWIHNGVGIPFVSFNAASGQYVIRCKRRQIFKGKFSKCMENIDRLIYCLDNNDGKLPPTLNEFLFKDLEFIKH